MTERSGCWIHGLILLDLEKSVSWERGWSHRRAWSKCPSVVGLMLPPSGLPAEGTEILKEQDTRAGQGRVEAEPAVCLGSFLSHKEPAPLTSILSHESITNKTQKRHVGAFSMLQT